MTKQTIFISYSHHDEPFKEQIINFFKGAKMPNTFQAWSDRDIHLGEEWEKKIFEAIDQANGAVLIITNNFLCSDYIINKEIPLLLKRNENDDLSLFPILFDPCPWEQHTWLTPLQMLPRDNLSLSTMTDSKKKEELTKIVIHIKNIMFPVNSQTSEEQQVSETKQSAQKTFNKIRLTKDWIFYDINRTLHKENIKELIIKYQTTPNFPNVAWIFHGHDNQCLNKFIERYINQKISKILKNLRVIDSIDWPQNISDSQTFVEKIATNVAWKIDIPFTQWKYKSVVEELNKYEGPVILTFTIYSEQWEDICKDETQYEQHCNEQIKGFIDFIRKWPNRSHGPLIALLMIIYMDNKRISSPKGIFNKIFKKKYICSLDYNHHIRQTLDTIKNKSYNDIVVFDELESIKCSDVKKWAYKMYVNNLTNGNDLDDTIDNIYSSGQPLPMKQLVKSLKQVR